MSNIKLYYKSGKMLGLTTKDIDHILKSNINKSDKPSLEAGPKGYPCGTGFYGTVSIKDFY